ncbi:MAG TPA: EAL domain-containing protein, partial [Rhodocyclaceae bacterium]|nr:EAL domain-containing protein [Rhodocyclaceae bacterium]
AIDDFGTGYSSLAYLKRLPINRLKLDRSFVHDINQDAKGAAICSATIVLGHDLGLDLVAEGVETTEQRDLLRDLGCDAMQGFLYCRPLPPDQVIDFLLGQQSQQAA